MKNKVLVLFFMASASILNAVPKKELVKKELIDQEFLEKKVYFFYKENEKILTPELKQKVADHICIKMVKNKKKGYDERSFASFYADKIKSNPNVQNDSKKFLKTYKKFLMSVQKEVLGSDEKFDEIMEVKNPLYDLKHGVIYKTEESTEGFTSENKALKLENYVHNKFLMYFPDEVKRSKLVLRDMQYRKEISNIEKKHKRN